jgi:hypothetical protein
MANMPPNFKVFHQKRRYGKPLPPPPGLDWTTAKITFDARPRTLQRVADLEITHAIVEDVCGAREFWTAWLTQPSLSEFKLSIVPTYTSLGLHPSFMSFFEGFWYTLKEAVVGTIALSPVLKSLTIQFTSYAHFVTSAGRIEKRTFGLLDLSKPTSTGDMIAADMFESQGMYWPGIEHLELPSQIVQAARHAYPEHPSQDFALGAACGLSLRRMFPFANIIVNGINVPDITTVDALLKVMPLRGVFEIL